ncbi:MAG TPA: HNH endonuclease signature motif containing protein [Thermoanaerobaculia bacterium]
MSSDYVSAELRRLVLERAGHLCEYCLLHADDMFFGCEVDHILSEKHGGPTSEDNLASACLPCNRNKGSDIASVVPGTGELVPLFNPRINRWRDHFQLGPDGVTIVPLTSVGEATSRILGFNDGERLLERQALCRIGRYPTVEARKRIDGIA